MNKLLLAGDEFMPEVHLREPGFTYSACGPFTKKNKNSIKKEVLRHIYRNEVHKVCFQHDITYRDFKDLPRRTASDILCDKAFEIASNPKYDIYQHRLVSRVY